MSPMPLQSCQKCFVWKYSQLTTVWPLESVSKLAYLLNHIHRRKTRNTNVFTITDSASYETIGKSNNEKVSNETSAKREISKINNLSDKNELNNLNNTFQQMSKLLENLEAKNMLVMNGK